MYKMNNVLSRDNVLGCRFFGDTTITNNHFLQGASCQSAIILKI